MRRFKYLLSNRINRQLHKKRVELLEKEAKKQYKANRLFIGTFGVLYWSMAGIFLIIMIIFEQEIEPIIGNPLFILLVIFVSFFLPAIILTIPYIKIEKKYPHQSLGVIPRDIIAQCNYPLVKFYKIPESYLVTKCYSSSNPLLVGKDVILFFSKDRLRIVNDFTTTIKDFGCYEFTIDEIVLDSEIMDNLATTVIKSKKITLSLGQRAKHFISSRGEIL